MRASASSASRPRSLSGSSSYTARIAEPDAPVGHPPRARAPLRGAAPDSGAGPAGPLPPPPFPPFRARPPTSAALPRPGSAPAAAPSATTSEAVRSAPSASAARRRISTSPVPEAAGQRLPHLGGHRAERVENEGLLAPQQPSSPRAQRRARRGGRGACISTSPPNGLAAVVLHLVLEKYDQARGPFRFRRRETSAFQHGPPHVAVRIPRGAGEHRDRRRRTVLAEFTGGPRAALPDRRSRAGRRAPRRSTARAPETEAPANTASASPKAAGRRVTGLLASGAGGRPRPGRPRGRGAGGVACGIAASAAPIWRSRSNVARRAAPGPQRRPSTSPSRRSARCSRARFEVFAVVGDALFGEEIEELVEGGVVGRENFGPRSGSGRRAPPARRAACRRRPPPPRPSRGHEPGGEPEEGAVLLDPR